MLIPTTEEELAEAIATADGPLAIQGGGTGGMATEGTPLSTAGLSGITLYEPGALTIVAKAGTPVAEIEAALAAENQMLAFEPMDYRPLLGTSGEPTIGGVVATNNSGPRRVQAGACRDFLLGTRFVDGTGTIIKNGGRVMKNVTGYDLSRLMCGAHGTLGVLSEVSLKVLPKPEAEATLVLRGLDEAQAVDVMSEAMISPFEVTGAAYGPDDGENAVMIRLEGFEGSVAYRAGELTKRLMRFAAVERISDLEASRALWKSIRDVTAFSDKASVTRVSLKPSDVSEMHVGAARVYSDPETRRPLYDMILDRAGGQAWIASDPEPEQDGTSLHAWLQSFSAFDGGHSTRVKGAVKPGEHRFQPEAKPLADMACALRKKYDPKGVLNPGLMG